MIGLWNDRNSALRQGITPIIRGIDWTDIRVLRIGYDREHRTGQESEQPVTLLIEVRKDSTSWEHAYTVVVACRAVIQQLCLRPSLDANLEDLKLLGWNGTTQ
ncbi:hypothetical protein CEP53_001661 [Fusarium sp. AF-6]|nr:hypothetical protein CEP53_001661 [Fusarium sp. AF-6]